MIQFSNPNPDDKEAKSEVKRAHEVIKLCEAHASNCNWHPAEVIKAITLAGYLMSSGLADAVRKCEDD